MIYDFFSSYGSVGRLQDYIVLVESFTLHGLENVTEPLSTYKWVNHSFIPLARTEQKKKFQHYWPKFALCSIYSSSMRRPPGKGSE